MFDSKKEYLRQEEKINNAHKGRSYLGPGPTISGQVLWVQYSDTVPYIKLTCSKNPMAETKIVCSCKIRESVFLMFLLWNKTSNHSNLL